MDVDHPGARGRGAVRIWVRTRRAGRLVV